MSDKEDTVLRGIQDISVHKDALRVDGSDDSLRRLEWLNTKTAVLKLGANSESELSYKLLKAKDAVSAAKWALDSGIVEGGGKALVKVVAMTRKEGENGFDKNTKEIFNQALCSPYWQLNLNDGATLDEMFAWDLNTEGVYDATLVIKNAVKNAVSLAGIVLTTGADIRFREKTKEEQELEILMLKNRPF